MPTKKKRINLAVPDDLVELLAEDAKALRLPVATRIVQIIDEHYKSKKKKTGSER